MKLIRRAERELMNRRQFLTRTLAGASALLLAGCNKLSETEWFPKLLGSAEGLSNAAQHLVTSRKSMAQEFTEADLSPSFRSNGNSDPGTVKYAASAKNDFAD